MSSPETNLPIHDVPLLAKRSRLLCAWQELAPHARFGDMTLDQFRSATLPSAEARTELAASKARISACITERKERAAALNELMKRVATAVCSDARFGDRSQLYRAMGFIPMDERRFRFYRMAVADPAEQSFASPSRGRAPLLDRFKRMVAAWEKAEVDQLNGIRLEELKAAGTALLESQYGRVQEHTERASLVGFKKRSDAAIRVLMKRVVAGVISSGAYGEDSALYRAMGYIPGSERRRRNAKVLQSTPD